MSNKKRTLVILAVSLWAVICMFNFLFAYPVNTDTLSVTYECVKLDENGAPIHTESESGYLNESTQGLLGNYISFLLKTTFEKKIDTVPTDVQLVTLNYFKHKNGVTVEQKTAHLAYDFYTQQVYLNRAEDGFEWYLVRNPKRYDKPLVALLNDAFPNSHIIEDSGYGYRGQSAWCYEEFQTYDRDNLTFRYALRWVPDNRPTVTQHDFKNSGFNNLSPVPVNSKDDAVKRAAEELGYTDPVGVAFYDETCGYWLVELYDDKDYGFTKFDNDYGGFLFESVKNGSLKTVIMNGDGVTLETYNAITRYSTFGDALGIR